MTVEQAIGLFPRRIGEGVEDAVGLRVGDGFLCTSGKDPELYVKLLDNVKEGAEKAGRDYESINRMIEIKVSYDRDIKVAKEATHWWAALALTPEEKEGVEDPVEMERLADNALDREYREHLARTKAIMPQAGVNLRVLYRLMF